MSTDSKDHIRVLICDDHAIVRKGLKQILAKAPDMAVCGEAETGKEVFEAIKYKDVDVLMLDLNLPDTDGWQVLNQMRIEHPDIPVLILSIYPENHYAIRCLKAGASGYLNKASAPPSNWWTRSAKPPRGTCSSVPISVRSWLEI